MKKQIKPIVPTFATEAEEAEWWFKNRNLHSQQLLSAAKAGGVQRLTKAKLLERIATSRKAASPVVAIRIPEADLALAAAREKQKAGW